MYTYAQLAGLAGADLGATAYRRVSQDDIDAFARVTGDRQWIHTDRRRAAAGPFGTAIAHGFLTLSLIGSFWPDLFHVADAPMAINYGLDRVRFTSPVAVGASVRLRAVIVDVTPTEIGMRITAEQTVDIEDGTTPALVATSIYIVSRPDPARERARPPRHDADSLD